MGSGELETALMKKGPWTSEEDSMLLNYVKMNGEGNWNSVRKITGLSRCGKSCRLRWANHLRPNLKKGQFTAEEEFIIQRLHAQMGNKWARMAAQLPGRTDNEIKNYWNTRVKRRQRSGLPLYPPEVVHGLMTPNFGSGFGVGDNGLRAKRARHLPVEYGLMMPMVQLSGYSSSVGPEPELPSSQVFGGGGGLLDVLLQGMNGGGGEKEEEMLMLGDPPAELKSTEPIEETNQETNDDISQLFDTIPTPSMPLPDWNDNSGDETSNGAQSGNDDIGLDLQQLAALFAAPVESEWNIGSCNWNNMPEIC